MNFPKQKQLLEEGTFFFARKRGNKIGCSFAFWGVSVLFGGVFALFGGVLCFLGVFFCFSRVSAISFWELIF